MTTTVERLGGLVDYYETVFADLQECLAQYDVTGDARWMQRMPDVIGRNGGLRHGVRYPQSPRYRKRPVSLTARIVSGEFDGLE